MKTFLFYDRYSNQYILEVRAKTEKEACEHIDNMSITELVIHTSGTGEAPFDFQDRLRRSIVKELP